MRLFTAALVVASALATVAGCGSVLVIAPDDGDGGGPAGDGAANADAIDPQADGGTNGELDAGPPLAPCTPIIGGPTDEARFCAPRFVAGAATTGGDGSAPFQSGAYAFNAQTGGFVENGPAPQVASFFISWDASALHFLARMTDATAVKGTGFANPSIEAMICAGDPDADYDAAHCVDFIVFHDGTVRGPMRYDTTMGKITATVTGGATDFTVSAKVPAADFGALVPGQHMMVNVNAISFDFHNASATNERSSVSAFFIAGRTCGHDAGVAAKDFPCGGGDQPYQPVTWARMILQ